MTIKVRNEEKRQLVQGWKVLYVYEKIKEKEKDFGRRVIEVMDQRS
jgi:hypothetical protein